MALARPALFSARLSGSGRARRRLLVIGDEHLVAAADEGLSAVITISKALAVRGQRTVGGIDVDVLWDLPAALRSIDAGPASWRLWRYDAVVVVLDADARAPRMERLLLRVLTDLARNAPVLVVAAAAVDGGTASRNDAQQLQHTLDQFRRTGHPASTLTTTLATDGRLNDPVGTADELLRLLDSDSARTAPFVQDLRRGPQDEQQRQHAVDRSIDALGAATPDLLRVVLLARNSFDVPYAQINLVSEGRLHDVAFAGRSSDALRGTLSGMVVLGSEALMIEDTRTDARCAGIEETRGADAIRFSVGHPIESPNGYRIGALCVFDTEPHRVDENDDLLIGDLALLAEAEINALIAAVGHPTSTDGSPIS